MSNIPTGEASSHRKNGGIPAVDGQDEIQSKRERIHEITQPARFDLIQDILMHPQQMPSIKEFEFLQPNRSRSTIREHLTRLTELNVVAEETIEKDRVKRGNPQKFFRLTEDGRQELEELDLLGIEETLQYLYANTEKPEDIIRYEKAPRPKVVAET